MNGKNLSARALLEIASFQYFNLLSFSLFSFQLKGLILK